MEISALNKNKIKEEYEVIIVGAGPAGCAVARDLSDKFRVLLIERTKFPRKKTCTGVIVEESERYFTARNEKVLTELYFKQKKLGLCWLDLNTGEEITQKRYIGNVSRPKFDSWLMEKIPRNVQIISKAEFISQKKEGKGIRVKIRHKGEIKETKTRYLIGADGALSSVKKGISKHQIKTYSGIQHWIKPKKNINKFYYIIDREITDFYSWLAPKNDLLVIGSALKPKEKEKFKQLKKKLKKIGIEGKLIRKQAGVLARPLSKKDILLGKGNVLLIGEAAGLISPHTGEGISFALISGAACAKAINENEKGVLKAYKEESAELIHLLIKKTDEIKRFMKTEPRVIFAMLKKELAQEK